MRLVLAMLMCTQLSGCWFVFIPASLMQKASDIVTRSEGEHCVSRETAVGQTIKLDTGQSMVVRSLSGTSSICQRPEYPIRAKLEAA